MKLLYNGSHSCQKQSSGISMETIFATGKHVCAIEAEDNTQNNDGGKQKYGLPLVVFKSNVKIRSMENTKPNMIG
jgi:hypothetical protein